MVTGAAPAGQVRDVVAPVIAAAGLALEDVQLASAGRRTVVRVVVDLPDDAIGSLDSDALGAVSRSISAAMDGADPVRGAYVLEVSTPGTDRPLTQLRHFRRARSRLVRLTMRDGSMVTGRLMEAEVSGLVVSDGASSTTVVPADVVRGVVEVELSRTDEQEEDA